MSDVGGDFLSQALSESIIKSNLTKEIVPRYMATKTKRTKAGDKDKMDIDDEPTKTKATDVRKASLTGMTPSYHTMMQLEVADDIKKTVCEVHETGFDES